MVIGNHIEAIANTLATASTSGNTTTLATASTSGNTTTLATANTSGNTTTSGIEITLNVIDRFTAILIDMAMARGFLEDTITTATILKRDATIEDIVTKDVSLFRCTENLLSV